MNFNDAVTGLKLISNSKRRKNDENWRKHFRNFSNVDFKFSEVLQDPAVQSKLSDTKAASEVKALEQFYQILQTEPARAFYGKNHVVKAAEAQAVETLLISDNLFRLV